MSSPLFISLLSHLPPQKHHPPHLSQILTANPDLPPIFITALSPTRNNPNYTMQEVISKLPRIERPAKRGFHALEIRTAASYFNLQCNLLDLRTGDPYWDPMLLLEQCPEQIQNLKPDSSFLKMDQRYAYHFYDYHTDSVLRGRVEMVLASVLSMLREMVPGLPELFLTAIKLQYLQETTNTLWYGKVDYSIGFHGMKYNLFSVRLPPRKGVVYPRSGEMAGYLAATRAARMDLNRKDTCVFGAVTDGELWQFYSIDGNGRLFISHTIMETSDVSSEEVTEKVFRYIAMMVFVAWEEREKVARGESEPVAARTWPGDQGSDEEQSEEDDSEGGESEEE